MKRRDFIGSTGAGAAGSLLEKRSGGSTTGNPAAAPEVRLANRSLRDLRRHFHQELFQNYLPFWDRHGVDHERGGFICSLDYDGTRVDTGKQMWFQGRGIWTYSFLHTHFGGDPRHLEIAARAKDFVLKHGPRSGGWWAEALTLEGEVLKPFQGDLYGMYFAAEGLQEYAWAAKDDAALQAALELMEKLTAFIESPGFRFMGTDEPGRRPQGLWMVSLRIATQILRRWKIPAMARLADRCVDIIVNRHHNPEIGLNNEVLNSDFSRPAGEETKCVPGHSVETLWMVMDEADRRGDSGLWRTCAERIRRHLEIGWDHVFGGFVQWVNVGQGCYEWPVERPVGTNLEFRATGEFHYMKTLWTLNEIQIATLMAFEKTRAEWASRFFTMAEDVVNEKFRKKALGLPGYMLFADRRMTHQPRVARQDNYHPPRQMMLNILTLDRMLKSGDARAAAGD